jgi:hypothetical protein
MRSDLFGRSQKNFHLHGIYNPNTSTFATIDNLHILVLMTSIFAKLPAGHTFVAVTNFTIGIPVYDVTFFVVPRSLWDQTPLQSAVVSIST